MESLAVKKIFSAIQPSAESPTIGNYYGAIKNWVKLQKKYFCIFAIADLHAITIFKDPKALLNNTLKIYAVLLSCGIDLKKSILFLQSQVSAHSELAWIINCHTQFGELSRMTQFKSKSQKIKTSSINAGLFTYPSLMAADILLYDTNLVPVGTDQKQHLELTRNIAKKFNNIYSEVFVVPEAYIKEAGSRIMSLQEPTRKMSKSDKNENSKIYIFDDEKTILHKFMRAVTDNESKVERKKGKDGVNNLMTIYSCATNKTDSEIELKFLKKGYGYFKEAVANAVYEELEPIQKKFKEFSRNKEEIKDFIKKNSEKASIISDKVLKKVKNKIGLILQ